MATMASARSTAALRISSATVGSQIISASDPPLRNSGRMVSSTMARMTRALITRTGRGLAALIGAILAGSEVVDLVIDLGEAIIDPLAIDGTVAHPLPLGVFALEPFHCLAIEPLGVVERDAEQAVVVADHQV